MRVIVADDAVLWRAGLVRVLEDEDFQVVAQAADAEELLVLVDRTPAEVVVLDIRMPPDNRVDGLRAAQEIRARHPSVGLLLLSQYLEPWYGDCLVSLGVAGVGYLLKDGVANLRDFAEAVRRVGTGGSALDPRVVHRLMEGARQQRAMADLTDRERTVLALMAEGHSNGAICRRLTLSPKTVESHVRSILMKLELEPSAEYHRRVLAVLAFLQLG